MINRRKFLIKMTCTSNAFTLFPFYRKKTKSGSSNESLNLHDVRKTIGYHLYRILDKEGPYGSYRIGVKQCPDLYSSCDLAQIRAIWRVDLLKSLSLRQRKGWITHINFFVNKYKGNGSYLERLEHLPLHAKGMTIGALGVLGGKQDLPTILYSELNTPDEVIPWLESIHWARKWPAAHLFWDGIHCNSKSQNYAKDFDKVFDWLKKILDSRSGWWLKGIALDDWHESLGGSVHILSLYKHKKRIFPFPERVIDSVLALQLPNKGWLKREGAGFMHYLEL